VPSPPVSVGVSAADRELNRRSGRPDLAHVTDAGSSLTLRAREIRKAFAWRTKWIVAQLVGVILIIASAEWLFARRFTPWLAQAWIGAGAVAVAWAVTEFLRHDGAQYLRDGVTGERQTAKVLHRFARRDWTIVHDIPRESWNIDHALVGLRGAIALDSKYTNCDWIVTEKGIEKVKLSGNTEPVPKPLVDARARAWDLHILLLGAPARVRTEVLPTLVLWGKVRPVPGGVLLVDGVFIAIGEQAKEWVPRLGAQLLTPDEVARARKGLAARKREHRPAG
jgi:hypothetical protein